MPFVAGDAKGFVRVANPLNENEPYLRREILDTLARRAEYNLGRMQGDVRLFEIGSVFMPTKQSMPHEELHVGALIMGRRRPPHFSDPKSDEFERTMTFDAWDAKAIAELMASEAFRGEAISLEKGGDDDLWRIVANGADVGSVRSLALDAPVWASPAFGVEISLGVIDSTNVASPGSNAHRPAEYPSIKVAPFTPLPTQPASPIDVALIVPLGIGAREIEKAIRSVSGDTLESVVLVDEYTGEKIEAGHRSLAWRLTFRHPERTLSAKEIEGRRTNVLRHLEKTLNVRARTT
jgi:phenylalanyl-tRNA synthetase beta chain